jgi:hypothetical protein
MAIVEKQASNTGEKYLAATMIRPYWLAGVTPTRIYWIRASTRGLSWQSATRVDLPAAVACFASAETQELLVVSSDGAITRVPIPS